VQFHHPSRPFAADRPHRLSPEILRILFALAWHTEWSRLLHEVTRRLWSYDQLRYTNMFIIIVIVIIIIIMTDRKWKTHGVVALNRHWDDVLVQERRFSRIPALVIIIIIIIIMLLTVEWSILQRTDRIRGIRVHAWYYTPKRDAFRVTWPL